MNCSFFIVNRSCHFYNTNIETVVWTNDQGNFFFVNGKTHLCMFTYVYTFCMIHVSVPCIFKKNYDVTYFVFMLISDAKWFFFAVFPLINKWNLVIIIIQNITTIVKNKLLVNCLLYAGILTRVVVSSDLLTSDVR